MYNLCMIKFVYFDVGGVVIQDFSGTNKWEVLRDEVCGITGSKERFEEIWASIKDTHNTTFDVDNLVSAFRRELNSNLPEDYSFLMGFVSRFEKNEAIWSVISEIKKHVPVGLLTNMYPRMLENVHAAGIMPKVDWDVVVDSSVVKLQKPDSTIYKFAEEKAMMGGGDILFIDNTQRHLDAAAKHFGWQTFLFDSSQIERSSRELVDYFNARISVTDTGSL